MRARYGSKTAETSAFGAVLILSLLMGISSTNAQTALAPARTLEVGAATSRTPDQMAADALANPLPQVQVAPFRTTMNEADYAAAKAAAESASPFAKPDAGIDPLLPPIATTINYSGVDQNTALGWRPPDTEGAVGKSAFVEVVNDWIRSFSKAVIPVIGLNKSLNAFFGYSTTACFDPRVIYDRVWNRWIVTADTFAESSSVQRYFIAISQSSSPTGKWWIYNVNVNFYGDSFYDFPMIGMDQDSILFTANNFRPNGFAGASLFAVAKARLYNGLGWGVPLHLGLAGTLAAPIVLDQNGNTYLAAAQPVDNEIIIYNLINSSTPNTQSLLAPGSMAVPAYTVPPAADQFGTTTKLDTLDSRFVNVSTQVGNDLWQVHTIALGSFPTPYFLRMNTATFTVPQQGYFYANSVSDDFNASIAANDNSSIYVTWTSTTVSAHINAEVRASGKKSADASIPIGGLLLKSSPTFYNVCGCDVERWGDYSAVTIDPSSTVASPYAWVINEWIVNAGNWGSQIARIKGVGY